MKNPFPKKIEFTAILFVLVLCAVLATPLVFPELLELAADSIVPTAVSAMSK